MSAKRDDGEVEKHTARCRPTSLAPIKPPQTPAFKSLWQRYVEKFCVLEPATPENPNDSILQTQTVLWSLLSKRGVSTSSSPETTESLFNLFFFSSSLLKVVLERAQSHRVLKDDSLWRCVTCRLVATNPGEKLVNRNRSSCPDSR